MHNVPWMPWCIVWILLQTTLVGHAIGSDLMVLGEKNLVQGNLNSAAGYLEQARMDQPHHPRILSDLGRVYFHLGDYETAEKMLRQSASLSPVQKWIICWNNVYLGKIYAMKGQFCAATELIEQVSSKEGTDACYQEAGKHLAYIKIMTYAREKLTKAVHMPSCSVRYNSNIHKKEDMTALANRFQKCADKILKLMNMEKNGPVIRIFIHPPEHQYDFWDGREILARYLKNECHLYYRGEGDMGHVEHEMVHLLTASYLAKKMPQPIWEEGLAEYVVGRPWGKSLDKWVKFFIQEGAFASLETLMNPDDFRKINPVVAYEEAGSFVKFLIENRGIERFLDFGVHGNSMEKAFNRSLADIEKMWLSSIDKIKLSQDEIALFRYRLELGDYFHNRIPGANGLPWIGVTCKMEGSQAVISSIDASSPSQQAGLKVGDIIAQADETAINGENIWELAAIVQGKPVGEKVRMAVIRNGKERDFEILIGKEVH